MLNDQLDAVEAEFDEAEARLERLARAVPPDRWTARPGPGRWSPGECIHHLNRTAEAFVPVIERALEPYRGGPRARRRYRRDPLGWALSMIMPPPVRFARAKTPAPFEPEPTHTAEELVARFRALQREQIRLLREADGLPLGGIRIRSPFDARARYNLYSCFVILARHQHRHLWQAERAGLHPERR